MAFKSTLWSTKVESNLVAATPLIEATNTDFEGEAKFQEAVKVKVYASEGTITDYDGVTPSTPETLVPDTVTLYIDQAKQFHIRTDAVDELQSGNDTGMIDKFLENTILGLSKVVQSKLLAHKADLTNNTDKTGTIPDSSNVVEIMEEVKVNLENENVSGEKFMLANPWFISKLRLANYLNVTPNVPTSNGGTRTVTMWDDIEILSSTLVADDGATLELLYGSKKAINFVGALERIEYGKTQGLFGNTIHGLYVYGSAVFNSKKGGTLTVSVA